MCSPRSRPPSRTGRCASSGNLTCKSSYLHAAYIFELSAFGSFSLNRLAASSEAHRTTLRFIDFFSIPRSNGDCVVLLLLHPGLNLLGRYLPPSKVNSLLLADMPRATPPSIHGDVYSDDGDMMDEMDASDIMDLASFLE
jgi:hypothetical protein